MKTALMVVGLLAVLSGTGWAVPPDYNNNGSVDFGDFDIFADYVRSGAAYNSIYDLNGSGTVTYVLSEPYVVASDSDKLIRDFLETEYGDLNRDYRVDNTDKNILISNWGMANPNYAHGDIDGDNDVDSADLSELMYYFDFIGGG